MSKLTLTNSFGNHGSLAICEQDDHTIVTCLSEITSSLENSWSHPQSYVSLLEDPKLHTTMSSGVGYYGMKDIY